jgi:hypothetical protein
VLVSCCLDTDTLVTARFARIRCGGHVEMLMIRCSCILLLLAATAGGAHAQDQASPPATEAIDDAGVSILDLLPQSAHPVVADLLDTLRSIEVAAAAGDLDAQHVNAERNRAIAASTSALDDIVGDDVVGRAAVALIGVRIAKDLDSPKLAAAFLSRMGDDALELPAPIRAELELQGLRTGRAFARTGEHLPEARALIRPASVPLRQTPTLRSFGHYLMGRIAADRATALAYFDRAYLEASAGESPSQAWLAAMSAISIADVASVDLWAFRLGTAVRQEENQDVRTFRALFSSAQIAPVIGRDAVRNLFGEQVEGDLARFADVIRGDIIVGSLAGTYFAATAMNAGWFDGADMLIASAEACINDERWENATGQDRAEHLALLEQLRASNAALRRGEQPALREVPVVCEIEIGEAVLTGAIHLNVQFHFVHEEEDEPGVTDASPLLF